MESPVVVDKPPEYHGNNDRGFPFEDEEGSGAWSSLAARHPDIAARLRQRPASSTWARKRRPTSQDATDDFGDSFSGFDRFPFDDIPAEFREHFPSHWNRRNSDREQPPPEGPSSPAPPPAPHQSTTATQTEHEPQTSQEHTLPQYGLRNTVDLGQKSPTDPSVDADERTQRSMSAPPDAPRTQPAHDMSAHNQEPHQPADHHSNVRHIPIFVEGRDEPVINKNVDHGTHFGESKPAYQPPPPQPQPHIDRDQYFADDGPVGFHHPPNFTRAFGTPFNKGFRQGPQPFVQQKAYPQNAYTRGPSPPRAQSPHREEHYVKVPVHHEPPPPRAETPSRAQHKPPPQKQPSPQPREQTPPRPQPTPNDPITQILSIQTDVLNLMNEVENFAGTKKDKRYLFLDEMLTRNLIKLDNIETEGKENIRQARKEAIRCIQKCIAVLEAKADSNGANAAQRATQDVVMKEMAAQAQATNGEVEMKEAPKEENVDSQPERIDEAQPQQQEIKEDAKRESTPKPQEEQTQKFETESAATQPAEAQLPADTRPEEPMKPQENADEQKKEVENKPSPKKKVVKKRDKSKDGHVADNKEAPKDISTEEASKDSNKTEVAQKEEAMQVDDKGDKPMEVDGAASQ